MDHSQQNLHKLLNENREQSGTENTEFWYEQDLNSLTFYKISSTSWYQLSIKDVLVKKILRP